MPVIAAVGITIALGIRGKEGSSIGRDMKVIVKKATDRNEPSVLTLRSCKMNQMPSSELGSVNLKALTQRLPIKLRVNMPLGCPEPD